MAPAIAKKSSLLDLLSMETELFFARLHFKNGNISFVWAHKTGLQCMHNGKKIAKILHSEVQTKLADGRAEVSRRFLTPPCIQADL